MLKAQDIIHLRAAPSINRLIVITHTGDIGLVLGQQPQPQILRDIGVLIFVHQHIAKAVLVLAQYIGMGAKQPQIFQQQITEIRGIEIFQALLIGGIKCGAFAIAERRPFARRNLVRGQAAVFPAIDQRGQRAGGPAFVIKPCGLDDLFHQADLVIGIQNREIGAQAHQFGMTA